MSWPPQIPPLQDKIARSILEDALQQLHSGKPAQSLQTILSLLSALHRPEEVAAVALKVQEAMTKKPSIDVNAQLASLLGSLTLSGSATHGSRPPPLPTLQTQFCDLDLLPGRERNSEHHTTSDIEMDQMDISLEQQLRGNRMTPSPRGAAATSAADGEASFMCDRCGSVISVARKAAHDQTWCPALQKQLPP